MPILRVDLPVLSYGGARLLGAADAPAIHDLYRRCDDYFLLQDGGIASAAEAETLFTDVPSTMSADDQVVVGWCQEQELYALACILMGYPKPGDWYLSFLLLDPGFRRRGIGHEIYVGLERWASVNGACRMLLAVLAGNEPALRFWQRQGFEELRVTGPTTYKRKEHVVIEFARSLW